MTTDAARLKIEISMQMLQMIGEMPWCDILRLINALLDQIFDKTVQVALVGFQRCS